MEENKMIEEETATAEEVVEEAVPVPEEEILKKETYVPRPKWQLVAAWVGIGIVAVGFALYLWQIATAGGK